MENVYIFNIGTSVAKNAGLCGLVYMLKNYGANEGDDFQIKNNILQVDKEYLNNLNIADAYVKAHVEKFKGHTFINSLIKRMNGCEYFNIENKEDAKSWEKLVNSISEMKKNRYANALINMRDNEDDGVELYNSIMSLINEISTHKKDLCIKEIKMLKNLFENPLIFEYLAFADIKLKLPAFWSNVAFLNKSQYKKNTKTVYNKYFVEAFLIYENEEKKGSKRCVDCGSITKDKFNIGFINAINDAGRKTSQFWNMVENANVCPSCAFVYSLMSLGYTHIGEDFVFINCNTSLKDLIRMNSRTEAFAEEKETTKSFIYKKITLTTLDTYKNNPGFYIDLKTMIKNERETSYKTTTKLIDSNVIKLFAESRNDFENLFGRYAPLDVYYNVYDNLIDNILNNQSLFYMYDFLLKELFKREKPIYFLNNILNIEIQKRSNSMEMKELRDKARYHGKKARQMLTKHVPTGENKNMDNALRSRVHRLSNAVQMNNGDLFFDIILQMYSTNGESIPRVLVDNIDDKEKFAIMGRGFLAGLTCVDYEKEKGENENE